MRFNLSSLFLITSSALISVQSSSAASHSNSPFNLKSNSNHKSHVPQSSGPLVGRPSPEQISQQAQVFANISKADQDGTARRISHQAAKGGKSTFTPINPPSIPLAVRGPYLNSWAPSGSLLSVTPPNAVGNGGYLAGQAPAFWTSSYGADGDYRLGWNGFIRVDNVTYQWQGDSFGNTVAEGKDAKQISMEYTATRSIFKFDADGVKFTVTFLTPITPNDYLRQSLPLSYLHFELDRSSASGRSVQMYTDIDERWASAHVYDYENYPIKMNYTGSHSGTAQYQITRKSPQVYTEFRQRAEWGSSVYAARNQTGLSSRNNNNVVTQKEFLDTGKVTYDHNPVGGPDNSFAFAIDFNAKKSKDDALFAIGHLRTPYVNYIRATPGSNGTKSYQEDRYGYWMTKFGTFADAVAFFLNDFESALSNAKKFDAKITEDSKSAIGGTAGDHYAAITALSVRQALATIEITVPYDKSSKKYLKNDTLIFLKEISSNGDMQTVDVFFPLFPLLTYLNPELLRDVMEPIFIYTESGLYPNKWCVHDLGVYPNGFGHNDGNDETMQVEESGNMVNMALHYSQLVGNKVARPYLRKHYRIMQQWTEYLIQDSLIPSNQLSTDDFAGPLANQTDLAIKGIEGIAAMGRIAEILGKTKDAKNYQNISSSYIDIFQKYAIDSTKTHTKLAYQDDKSWGTLYNIFFDRLLNLKLVPKSLYDLQDNYYPTQIQEFGLPLDSRHNWTKTDWEMFASAASAKKSTKNLLINKLYKFVSSGRTDSPFSDLMEATTGDTPKPPFDPLIHFLARPVVGGHFAHLALVAADTANSISDSNPYQYGPEPKKNVTYTFISSALKVATAAKNGRVEQVSDSEDSSDDDEDSSNSSSTVSSTEPSSSSGSGSKSSSASVSASSGRSKSGSKSQSRSASMTKSRSASRQSVTPTSTSINGKNDGKDQKPFGVDFS